MTKQFANDKLLQQISLVIKELREEQNITLEVFYIDTGIHLARIEQGKTNITISTLSQICEYFDISLKDFFALIEELEK